MSMTDNIKCFELYGTNVPPVTETNVPPSVATSRSFFRNYDYLCDVKPRQIIYRGELNCPFDSENERSQGLFWMFKELLVRHSLNDPTFIEYYKQVVARYI